MAASSSTCFPQTLFRRVYPTHSNGGRGRYSPVPMPRFVPLVCSSSPRSSVIAFLRPRRGRESRLAPRRPPPKKKTALDDFMKEEEQEDIGGEEKEEEEEEEQEDEEEYPELDVLNDFFAQLEKDINNHELSDDDLEIDEEDLLKFEKELTQALGEAGVDLEEEGVDEEEDNWFQLPELKTWQLRKLARALNMGRRKTNIKKLSEDVGLDRTTVLEFLRNPPPNLLLMSDSLPDEPSPQAFTEPEKSELNSSILTDGSDVEADETEEAVESKETKPEEVEQQVRSRRGQFAPQKRRLKKVQVETLERVYYKTKRPTNEMISSIVHVTNLPRKVILNWFEEKRVQDGIPQEPLLHARYKRRSVTKTSFR